MQISPDTGTDTSPIPVHDAASAAPPEETCKQNLDGQKQDVIKVA